MEVGAEPISERHPLRAIQRNFVAAQLHYPSSPALNMGLLVRFSEPIDSDRLVQAFDQVVMASDVLRTTVTSFDPEHARVLDHPPAPTRIEPVEHDRTPVAAALAVQTPMDLATSCYRSTIFEHEDGTASWLLTIHHVATDATSHTNVIETTLRAYLGVEPPVSNFYDWVDTESHNVSSELAQYWADTAAPAARTFDDTAIAARVELDQPSWPNIDAALNTDYRLLTPELSRAAFLVLATALYLGRSGADDVTVALPVHHRSPVPGSHGDDVANLIGPTLNMYPVRIDLDPSATVKELHRHVARHVMQALRHAHPGASPSGSPEAIVNVITRAGGTPVPGLAYSLEWLHAGRISPHEVLRVHATAYDQSDTDIELFLDIASSPEAVDVTAASEVARFAAIVQQLLDDPSRPIRDITTLTAEELALTSTIEHGPARSDSLVTVASQLRQALQNNDAIAIVDGDERVTGRDLWRWIRALASQIARDYNRHDRIAVELDRSVQAVVAIFAIVVSGRSFVPIDPTQPERRKQQLRTWAGIAGAFTLPDHVDQARVDATDNDEPGAFDQASIDDEAYVLFTSGSTGQPKGVPISGRGLSAYLDFACSHYFDDDVRPVAPLYTALTFDLTITTLFGPLLRGGELHIVRPSGGAGLAELALNGDVNWCKATPSHLASLLRLAPKDLPFTSLVVGGESFTTALAREIFDRSNDLALFNEYGPTEAVVGCMFHRVTLAELAESEAVSIGVPAPGVQLRVVDSFDQRTSTGVPGELLISHDAMTEGYLQGREPDRFVHLDGERFYRSGDCLLYTS